MTAPINMHLYRLLLKVGADEAEAEQAARLDAFDLVTKSDLAAAITGLKAELIMWMTGLTVAQLLAIVAALIALR